MKVTITPKAAAELPKENQYGTVAFVSFASILETLKANGYISNSDKVISIQIEKNGLVFLYEH